MIRELIRRTERDYISIISRNEKKLKSVESNCKHIFTQAYPMSSFNKYINI